MTSKLKELIGEPDAPVVKKARAKKAVDKPVEPPVDNPPVEVVADLCEAPTLTEVKELIREIVTPDMLEIDTAVQGTPEWLAARAGFATGSCFQDIIALSKPDKYGKQRPLKSRETYMWKLVAETLYGAPMESPNSQSMQWGKDVEPFAREAYEAETGYTVIEAGFIKRKTGLPRIGVSLDGLVGTDGTIEMKCPKDSVVHVQTWAFGMPEEHYAQVQGGLWVSGREWCDFISYDPRATPGMRLYVQRIHRDEKFIMELSNHVTQFMAEVEEQVQAVLARMAALQQEAA